MRGPHVVFDGRVLGQRGVGRYSSNLLRGLAELRSDFLITVAISGRGDPGLVPQDPRFRAVPMPSRHPAWQEQLGLPRLARRIGADAIHFPDNSGALRPGLPMVLTLHDTMWARPLKDAILHPSLRQRAQDLYRKWVCPRAARAAAVVLTVSEHSRSDLVGSLGLDEGRVWVTPNGLEPGFGLPLRQARAASLRRALGVNKRYVLCSGAADRRKNIDRLIFAFAQARRGPLRDAQMVITSLREGEVRNTEYLRSARACGVERALVFTGYLDDEGMRALYQGAAVYAFPSLWEGFGLPVLEAFSLGAPVLAARAGALPEVAGNAARLVDPLSVADMAHGLLELAGKEGARRRAAGFKAARRWRGQGRRSAAATLKAYARAIQAR